MNRYKGKINTDQLLNKMGFDCDKMIDSNIINKNLTTEEIYKHINIVKSKFKIIRSSNES
jgi:hypothetical protein